MVSHCILHRASYTPGVDVEGLFVKILLGAVPFGCDNVGDEAILKCTVATLREAIPKVVIGVCTAQPLAAAHSLGVAAHTLFGFKNGGDPRHDDAGLDAVLAGYDAFMWAGATGLSDYPEVGVRLMNRAQARGLRTVLWCVGMNDTLNPKLYQVWRNPLARAASRVATATKGRVNLLTPLEARKAARVRGAIGQCLNRATLRVVRDPESKAELRKCGVMGDVVVGADPALLLDVGAVKRVETPETVKRVIAAPGATLGVCLSSQSPLQDFAGFAAMLDTLLETNAVGHVMFIPMNPNTDNVIGASVRQRMRQRDRTTQLEGERTASEIQAVISAMDAVVASRLHALILASNVGVPFVAIARGTKFNSFLAPFDLEPAGTVDACDMDRVAAQIRNALTLRKEFARTNDDVRAQLGARYAQAVEALSQHLAPRKTVFADSSSDAATQVIQ